MLTYRCGQLVTSSYKHDAAPPARGSPRCAINLLLPCAMRGLRDTNLAAALMRLRDRAHAVVGEGVDVVVGDKRG